MAVVEAYRCLDSGLRTLPTEIARLICEKSRRADLPSLRLVSKFWNNIASLYLLPTPKFIFKQDSFDRLLDIANHPFFSEHVTGLVYEPNTLQEHDRLSWEDIPTTVYTHPPPLPPGLEATEGELRAYTENCKRAKKQNQPYSRKQLDKAWSMYEKFFQEQEDLRKRDYGTAQLTEAISKFTNLRKVSMNHGFALWNGAGYSTDKKKNPYAQAMTNAGPDNWNPDLCGIPHMCSLLLALHKSNIELQSLSIGQVNWRFLMLDQEIRERMKKLVRPVERLELVIGTSIDDDEDEIGQEIPDCRNFLNEDHSLHDLVSAATKIEHLRIAFDWSDPYAPADLNNVVQSTKWAFLKYLALECIETSSEVWLAFLKRHASTLRHLELCKIALSRGSWIDGLERMQQVLSLESVSCEVELTGMNPQQRYDLGPDIWTSHSDMRSQGNRTRKAIEGFLVHGGPNPLCDEEAHPNLPAFP